MENILFIIILTSSVVYSQIKSDYVNFYEDKNYIFLCDSLSIKRTNNVITCKIIVNPTKQSIIKNHFIRQYMLNSYLNKYYILGEIEYDSKMRIVNTNNSTFVNPAEAKSIEKDTVIYSLAKYLNQFFKNSIFSINMNLPKEKLVKKEDRFAENKDSIVSDSEQINLSEKNIYQGIEQKISEEPTLVEEGITQQETIAESPVKVINYSYNNEYNVEGTIFSDGALYCYQVSSWKNKSVAEKEVQKLIKKGFNAFIMQAKIGNDKNIWYRVRVGFFNSLEEAKDNQKKSKN